MIHKKINLIQLGVLTVLSLLLLITLLIYNFSGFNKREDRLEISVVFREWSSGAWEETRRGMEKAAADYGIELRFLTLQKENSMLEQEQMIIHECENGADGLIIVPVNGDVLNPLKKEYPQIPYVVMESLDDEGFSVTVDNQKVGEMLSQAVVKDFKTGATALFVDPFPNNTGIQERLNIAEEKLKQEDYSVLRCGRDNWMDFVKTADFIVSPEVEITNEILDFLGEQADTVPVYTVGYSQEIVAGLENETVAAAVVWSGYGVGYQALQQIFYFFEGKSTPVLKIPIALVRKEDMYERENQKILFPIDN